MKAVWSFHLPENFIFETYNEAPPLSYLEVKQTHSNKVAEINERPCEADGLFIEKTKFQNLGIKTADCLPILLFGKNEMALIHAGWRGLKNQILLDDKVKKCAPTLAIIGPAIQQKNYPVDNDIYELFFKKNIFKKNGEKWLLHLGYLAQMQLQSINPQILVIHSPLDTFESPNLHSYRKNQTPLRNYNIVRRK